MTSVGLSKSRALAGLQCPKLLWWKVHEPAAPELDDRPAAQAVSTRGAGRRAGEDVRSGRGADRPATGVRGAGGRDAAGRSSGRAGRVRGGVPRDGVFVAVDILERGRPLLPHRGQVHHRREGAARARRRRPGPRGAAERPRRRPAEVMHLNRACAYPDLANLFVRADVTGGRAAAPTRAPRDRRAGGDARGAAAAGAPRARTAPSPTRARSPALLAGAAPASRQHALRHAGTGRSSSTSRATAPSSTCPRTRPRTRRGPAAARGSGGAADRRARAWPRRWRGIAPPVAFLDFETVGLAVPVWHGCHPYDQVPVQFSCHVARTRPAA